jgi:flagellar hook-length control protein FliK
MMNTLNSSLLNLKSSTGAAPPTQPQAAVAQSKRFANIMAKVQATAPQAASPKPAKPVSSENSTQARPSSEASRAEANARNNAIGAARLAANRALVKAPQVELTPQAVPHIEPHIAEPDRAATEANQADSNTVDATATMAADMTAWVAALNPAPAQPTATAASLPSGEAVVAESGVAAQMMVQAAGQAVTDKNTQVLREESDAETHGDAPRDAHRGVAAQRSATDLHRLRPAFDGTAPSGREGQPSESRGSRQASDVRAAAGALTAQQTDVQNSAPAAITMTMLGKEVTASASASASATTTTPATTTTTTAASASTDFSALMASNLSAANTQATASGTGDTLSLSLATPVNAPEFREALGVQVSLLARDGVQTAELHLNPADMGPVSVQIIMEGSQARVDFGADVAATRAAIEAGMPELASAMRDAGFTLAGGGVSQHAKNKDSSNGENRQGSTRRNVAATAPSLAASTAPMTAGRVPLTAGGVDLFV